jgi:transcriptional regulator with XRE-family HTH domain
MAISELEASFQDPAEMQEFFEERSLEGVSGLICDLMERHDVNRAELANRLGKTRGWVTQLLDGEKNKTIRTLADVFFVLGYAIEFKEKPIEDVFRPASATIYTIRLHSPDEADLASDTGQISAPFKRTFDPVFDDSNVKTA